MCKLITISDIFIEAPVYVSKMMYSLYPQSANKLIWNTQKEFIRILPDVPYIGGKKNWLSDVLFFSAWCLAFHRCYGKAPNETGELLYKVFKQQLAQYPEELLVKSGEKIFTPENRERVKKNMKESHKRQYAEDWAGTFLEYKGEEFDVGYDYSECGVCKFFHSQGAVDFLPYICLFDIPISQAMDTGLIRKKALGNGDDCCDFRFKKGRKVQDTYAELLFGKVVD